MTISVTRASTRPLVALLAAIVGVVLAGCGPAPSGPADWVAATAVPLAGVTPREEQDDLSPLARSVGAARIVGLGESTHGVAEQIHLKHRALRLMVERLGFRSLAWEEDWTLGLEIDDFLRGGAGDPEGLVARMSPQWRSREVADVLRWLRGFNDVHPDKVRFVGVEYYATPAAAYDRVQTYVAGAAPDRSAALTTLLDTVRPRGADIYEYIRAVVNAPDEQPALRAARAVDDLVATVPHTADDRDHALARHTSRQILSFYEHHLATEPEGLVRRDARAAENLRWWHELTGDKVVYWAASPHTAAAPDLRITGATGSEMRFPSAGSYLRRWYGSGYRSVGVTVGHGAADLGDGQIATLAEPGPDQFERPLEDAGLAAFALDLHAASPPEVRRWLSTPASFRGLPDRGAAGRVSGGAPATWFDVILHSPTATPTGPLP